MNETGTEPSTPAPTHVAVKRKRGRPSKASLDEARRLSTPLHDDDAGQDTSDIGTPLTNAAGATPQIHGFGLSSKKRRGRPPASAKAMRSRGGPSHVTSVPLDKDGNPQEVEDDEIVLPEDPAGEEKVDKFGYLQGGREYRCRTFTILGRGERLYMLSTEPARCIGFRDSYLFFQKHKQLFKIIMDEDEKFDMIKRDLIPHSYKGRAIGVVTARSVFREFGARIVVGGRRVTDDYWEAREIAAGAVEGQLADPEDRLPQKGEEYNRNQYVAWHGASSVYHTGVPSVPMPQGNQQARKKKVVVTDTNWMLEHSRAASQFNSRLLTQRQQSYSKGAYEPHTNLIFLPEGTQPTRAKWQHLPTDDVSNGRARGVVIETVFETPPNNITLGIDSHLGFTDWSQTAIDSLETEEERAAVKEQIKRQKAWREKWGLGEDGGLGGGLVMLA
ncbi:chromatin remodelling complex Rsc7/Swp82 subunit-domain-containing protein [Tuber borchii]|uniref:Chromatin remodelling complex Rsc7/Swp82 subunit-domain-containing protein n=1 Tax=Tuber borchii TaxID=42251 RepID=A0A2T6ZC97_TUBBO|nr:chromatin remodelling complex Rsc7/Swp82 subunit-domain-containing protein [Tuber borchii]